MQMFWKARIVKSKYLPLLSSVCPCVSHCTAVCPSGESKCTAVCTVLCHSGVLGWFFAPGGLFATFFVPTVVLNQRKLLLKDINVVILKKFNEQFQWLVHSRHQSLPFF